MFIGVPRWGATPGNPVWLQKSMSHVWGVLSCVNETWGLSSLVVVVVFEAFTPFCKKAKWDNRSVSSIRNPR